MDYVWFVVIVAVLVGLWWLTKRMDHKAKDKCRADAYRLLDSENPSKQEINKVMKTLLLYGGRIRRDKEFLTLRERLSKKLHETEGTFTSG